MSNKRYRRLPGTPATDLDAWARKEALRLLEGPLGEIMSELETAKLTVDLYKSEVRQRLKMSSHTEPKRWQVTPNAALRTQAMQRKLREKRDALIAEAEQQALDRRQEKARETEQEENTTPPPKRQSAPSSPGRKHGDYPDDGTKPTTPPPPQTKAKSRDPAHAA